MEPEFAIHSVVSFGQERWTVLQYHKTGVVWEIIFQSNATGVKRSIPCSQLETYF